MAKVTEVRLTLAAFIYGIELDLKTQLKKYVVPFHSDLSFLRSPELIGKVTERFLKENQGVDIQNNLLDAVDYLDFADVFVNLGQNGSFLPAPLADYLKKIYPVLVDITPIRNRVMHTRPLLGGDFSTVYGFVAELKANCPLSWAMTLETREKIESDPTYVLTLKIPRLIDESLKVVQHNLPTPDFDETGFIGRKQDVDDIKKLVFGNRVVSIIGDGGIGKTALALKIAYDIVDLGERSPFELIIWTSAKTTMLTAKGVEEILSAIKDYSGLIDSISETLSSGEEKSYSDKLKEILEYLDLFKTLLIIDNLETIQNEDVRDFIREAQMKCHIVITSRIGLGELEYPRKLKGLTETESAKLIREIARIRNSETLLRLPQATLIDIASKLYYNPLALKWFVNTVEVGIQPSEVLNNKNNLLNFCLSNVYDKLSEGAVQLLNVMRAARKNLRTAEIIYLSGQEPIKVQQHLIELFKTTLISREILDATNIEDTVYFITDFAKDFLSQNYPLDAVSVRKVMRMLKDLSSSATEIKRINTYNELSINALAYRTPNERIAAKFLSEALSLSRSGRLEDALKKVTEAKAMVPNYVECYRISAFIRVLKDDILGAEEDYSLGLEIEQNNPRLLFYYSQFLLFHLEDADEALRVAETLQKILPNHPFVSFHFARIYNVKQDYNKAIHIIKEMLTRELDPKNKRVAYTELISFYTHMAQSLVRIENDYSGAINHYKKAFATFEDCNGAKIVDSKMVKNFCESLLSFVQWLPSTVLEDNKDYFKEIVLRHAAKISFSANKEKIIRKFQEKIDDLGLNNLLENDTALKQIGSIRRSKSDLDRHYVFIESNNSSFYANRKEFLEIRNKEQWRKVRHGQLVSFEIGENERGRFAKNIGLVQ